MSRLVPYLGGKRLLTKTILNLLPEHRLYCEPFAGSATILLAKQPSPCEVLNDLNGELINLFRIVQNHPEEFLKCMRWNLRSRAEFARLKEAQPGPLTDIHRAVRFYYLLRTGYGGKLPEASCHFAGRLDGSSRPFLGARAEQTLFEVHLRLENVVVEQLPYGECLRRYDGLDSLFYLDPPYWGFEDLYGKGIFGREDFQGLAAQLQSLKGRFLMSLNDLPEVREIFKDHHLREVTTTYTAGTGGPGGNGRPAKKARELLIANYEMPQI